MLLARSSAGQVEFLRGTATGTDSAGTVEFELDGPQAAVSGSYSATSGGLELTLSSDGHPEWDGVELSAGKQGQSNPHVGKAYKVVLDDAGSEWPITVLVALDSDSLPTVYVTPLSIPGVVRMTQVGGNVAGGIFSIVAQVEVANESGTLTVTGDFASPSSVQFKLLGIGPEGKQGGGTVAPAPPPRLG